MRAVFVFLAVVAAAMAFSIEMEIQEGRDGQQHMRVLKGDADEAQDIFDHAFLAKTRNHLSKAALGAHHVHQAPLEGMMDAINHIFNDNNEQSPLAALHELTHRAREEQEQGESEMPEMPEMPEMTHDHFMPPMEIEIPRAMNAIQEMIQHMVRPMFEPREVRHGPPRGLVALACHEDAVRYCRKYCSCWKGMTQCLERHQDEIQPRCKHLLTVSGIIQDHHTETFESPQPPELDPMPPTAVQDKLRKVHHQLGEDIAAHERAVEMDQQEESEEEKAQDEEDEKRKTSQVESAMEGTPGYLMGESEMPQGEKDMGGWTMRVYTPEQQARLGLDEAGEPVAKAATVNAPATQAEGSHKHKDKKAAEAKVSGLDSVQLELQKVRKIFLETHPVHMLIGVLGLFVLSFLCGACNRRRNIDELSGQYDRLTSQDTPLNVMGSENQL